MGYLSGHEPYTLSEDRIVEEHIHNIVKGITEVLITEVKPTAVVLSGSLSRGEATAYQKDGHINLISDFEIGCVDSNWLKRRRLKKLEPFLAERHGIDLTLTFFLPRRFAWGIPANWAPVGSSLSIDQYELVKAARFIYGPDLRRNASELNSDDIPVWEGIRLLFNRMAEFAEAVLLELPARGKGLLKACSKLLIASGDVLLLISKCYHHFYRERRRCFQELLEARTPICNDLSADENNSIIQAYSFKLYPQEYDHVSIESLMSKSISVSEKIFKFVIHSDMGLEFSSYEEFYERYLAHPKLKEYCRTKPKLQNIVTLLKTHGQTQSVSLVDFFRSISVLNTIYAEIPVWLYSHFKPQWDVYGYDCLKHKEIDLEGRRLVENWKRLCM